MHTLTSAAYIQELRFTRAETYSLLRGDYQAQLMHASREYAGIETRIRRGEICSPEDRARHSELSALLRKPPILLQPDGSLHGTARKTHVFTADAPEMLELREILSIPFREHTPFMCPPVYRDAVLFFDEAGGLISVLNICLSCEYLITQPGAADIAADSQTYPRLRTYFRALGHPLDEDSPPA